MEMTVPAADANRKFSELLRGVRKGRRYVVTCHGKPVAKLVPAEMDEGAVRSSRVLLFERLQSQKPVKGSAARRWWNREDLYEDAK
jgi:prevent-host-death family protein